MADHDDREIDDLLTLDEIRSYVAGAYRLQGRKGGKLPLAVAQPDFLILRAVELAGAIGISTAELRRAIPVGVDRMNQALRRVAESGLARRVKERRVDALGRRREQWVWYPATLRDPYGESPT